jgi:hypothetical protein
MKFNAVKQAAGDTQRMTDKGLANEWDACRSLAWSQPGSLLAWADCWNFGAEQYHHII